MQKMPIQDFLIHALAGLGEAAGLEDQERLWQNGDAAVRIQVLEARARHAHLRVTGLRAGLRDSHPEVQNAALELLREGPYHPELAAEVAHCLENGNEEAFELVVTLPPDERFVPGLAAFLATGKASRAAHHIRRTASQDASLLGPVLAMLRHPEASTHAQKALRYPNRVPEVLDALLEPLSPALAFCQDRERLRDELRKRLESDTFAVSVSAAQAMAWCGRLLVRGHPGARDYGCAGHDARPALDAGRRPASRGG